MKLLIQRTSLHKNEKPCEEAFSCKFKWENKITKQTIIEDRWFVEFKSLKQLMEFVVKYKVTVLDKDSIEIYDDYRE